MTIKLPKSTGKCYSNEENKKFWIDIPKCASKTISYHLYFKKGYKDDNFLKNENLKLLDYEGSAVIRDPIERWYAGALEICYHYSIRWPNNWEMFKHRFNYFNFEEFHERKNTHLNPQSSFFDSLDLNKIHFIMLDDNFEINMREYFDIEGKLYYENRTEENEIKKKISEEYIWDLYTRKDFRSKLTEYYAKDYELIEHINS